jgi:lysophospholipase L1-like esterase
MKEGLIIILTFLFLKLSAQDDSWLYQVNQFNFIRYDLNEMYDFGDDKYSSGFYNKLEKIITTGEGRINVIQIGGSHIQAGIFSGQIRSRMQQMNGELNAGWGFMFPYRMSRTNSPYGYYIRYNGGWQSCRNIEKRKTCNLGVGGISATTSAPVTELTVLLEDGNSLDYSFNKLRIFYENAGADYAVSVDSSLLKNQIRTNDYYEFELNRHVDSLKITFDREPDKWGSFTLFGIVTERAPNGIMYHSIGVNGAHVPAFLRCQLFEKQMALLKPDLVILGLGINDAYGRRFSQKKFEDNYGQLIERIRRAAPETAIIFTTNNDSYLYRRYVNKNGEKVQQSMFKMAKKYQTGVWDMYSVMGGLNSIVLWQNNGLAKSDKVHFTREGYLTLGDLFFNALMNNFERYMRNKNHRVTESDIEKTDTDISVGAESPGGNPE